jgi:hypothetical protein
MGLTRNDLENILAIVEEDPDAKSLTIRCSRALAYADVSIHITGKDRKLLAGYFDPDMDPSARETLEKLQVAAI